MFQDLIDIPSAQMPQKFADQKSAGWQCISMAARGGIPSLQSGPFYTSTWVKRSGPDQTFMPSVGGGDFDDKLTNLTDAGWRPTIICAVGTTQHNSTYAAVCEMRPSDPVPKIRRGIPWWTASPTDPKAPADSCLVGRMNKARADGTMLRWIAVHGPGDAPIYTGIFDNNPTQLRWSVSIGNREGFDAQFKGFVIGDDHPAQISVSDEAQYATIWHSGEWINAWSVKRDLDASGYADACADAKNHDGGQIRVGVGGDPARFTAIFALTDKPMTQHFFVRRTTASGIVDGSAPGAFGAIDDWIKQRMQFFGCKYAAIAIARHGKLAFANAYTQGPDGCTLVQPTTPIRIGSVSKSITALAVFRAQELGQFSIGDLIQGPNRLNLATYDGDPPPDPRVASIHIEQLLTHTSGLIDDGAGWDDFTIRDEVVAHNGKPGAVSWPTALPVSLKTFAASLAGRHHLVKGSGIPEYCNTNFSFLGRLLEKTSGTDYPTFVRTQIFDKLGIPAAMAAISSEHGAVHSHDEVHPHALTPDVGPSPMLNNSPLVPSAEAMGMPIMSPPGGWAIAPAALTRILTGVFDQPHGGPVFKRQDTINQILTSLPAPYTNCLYGFYQFTLPDESGTAQVTIHHNGAVAGGFGLHMHRADGVSYAIAMQEFPTMPNPFGYTDWLYAGTQGAELNDLANAVPASGWPTADLFPVLGMPSF
jgi:N-acyl-D-amino-acid deacylase